MVFNYMYVESAKPKAHFLHKVNHLPFARYPGSSDNSWGDIVLYAYHHSSVRVYFKKYLQLKPAKSHVN